MSSATTSTRKSRLRVLASLVAVLLGVAAAMLWGIRSFEASSRGVSHTYQVLAQIEATRAAIDRTESASRGYRLSGNPGFESEYVTHRPKATARAEELVALVADSPPQRQRARRLGALVAKRLTEIDAAVSAYRAGRLDMANRAMLAQGRTTHASIEAAAEALRSYELELLADLSRSTQRDAWVLTAIVIVGMLVSLTMLWTLLAMVDRETRRARHLEVEARGALTTLEGSVAEREALAEQRRILGAYAGLLHSCESVEEALGVTGNALAQLVPHGAGICYLMRASQNLLEREVLFGTHGSEFPEAMRPEQCWALRRGHLHAFDPRNPTAVCGHLRGMPDDHACGACVPLIAQGGVLGLVHVSTRRGDALTETEKSAVESVGEHLALVLHSLQLRESLRVQSLRDPLTGLYNRRYLDESLPREMERCERRGRPLSVLMLDIDNFKRFNDEHGHGAGDAVLTRIGEVIASLTRDEDIACRFGGEEFTVVMPEADLAQATARAEAIREAVAAATVPYMRRELGRVTASIGVHEFRPGRDTPQTLMATADRALYAAKAQGRNRVLSAAPEPGLPAAAQDGPAA